VPSARGRAAPLRVLVDVGEDGPDPLALRVPLGAGLVLARDHGLGPPRSTIMSPRSKRFTVPVISSPIFGTYSL